MDNIARHVTDDDYEADESRGIKPDVDDSSNLMYNLPLNNSTDSSNLHFAIFLLASHIKLSWENVYIVRIMHCKSVTILDSIADLSFVICCAIILLPALSIPSWLWIWAGIIVIIKIVNQISSLIIIKKICFPHTIANKLTGFLLFIAVPTINWSIIPIAVVAAIASVAAIQEGHLIRLEKNAI